MINTESLLSEEERAVLIGLSEVWDAFLKLESLHSADKREFEYAIHIAQNIVLARPTLKYANL